MTVLLLAAAIGLHLTPCTEGHARVPALCGTFSVYENRATSAGRVIALHVIVLLAKHSSNRGIYYNPGGPGGPTLSSAADIADGNESKELSILRDRYNIVLVDNRGTGESHPLQCDLSVPLNPGLKLRQIWPISAISTCRSKLAASSELRDYTTANAADDLDDLRAALDYPKIVLDGTSYGTYFSLVYAKRHREHVESAVLQGVVPPRLSETLFGFADAAQSAMDKLIADCQSDHSCDAHYPNFRLHFERLVKRLDRGPIMVVVRNPSTGRLESVPMSKEVFAENLRRLLYDINSAVYIPYIIDRAYDGDTLPLGTAIETAATEFAEGIDLGALFSYSCAEYVPFVTEPEIRASSKGTFLGDARIRAQQRVCSIWNVPTIRSANSPIRTDIPILMVSGTNDPATPPEYSAEQLEYLPNARRVLVRGASHVTETTCADDLIVAFVKNHTAAGLDVDACFAAYKRPTFATSMSGFLK